MTTEQPKTLPFRDLDHNAQLASVDKPSTISNLTNAVLAYPHFYKWASPVLKSALLQSEARYRRGTGSGISETQLLTFLNKLATQLKLPGHAIVTQAQMRHLRRNLALQSPYFMDQGLAQGPMKEGDSIGAQMSPLQAYHVASTLIDQKLLNPDYQDPQIDLASAEAQRRQKLMSQGSGKSRRVLMHHSNPKLFELAHAINANLMSLSLSDLNEIVNEALQLLGQE